MAQIKRVNDHYEIYLYNRQKKLVGIAIFDQENKLQEVSKYIWYLHVDGYAATRYRGNINSGHIQLLHKLLMGDAPAGMRSDHINHNRLDNRKSNLRFITYKQNNLNRSGTRGYSWYKRDKKWRAYINIEHEKQLHLGYFDTEEDARAARLAAEERYFPGIIHRR